MVRVTHAERVQLADDVYLKGRTEIKAPPGWVIEKWQENPKSGLEIYALRKENTNEVVFAVRGSDTDGKDWEVLDGPNFSHIAGKLHEQDKEALTFVDIFKKDNKLPNGSDKFDYSVTGDSKGGAIAQIISNTFGMRGTTTDPAAGGGVVKDPDYLDFVRNELETVSEPLGVPKGQFLNIREEGSPVPSGSGIFPGIEHLGETVSFDFVVAKFRDAFIDPVGTILEQHTIRTERISAFSNARSEEEVDPIYILINDKISSISLEINSLEARLSFFNAYQGSDSEDQKEIKDIERELYALNSEKNEVEATRQHLMVADYGDADGYVDQERKSYLESVRSNGSSTLTANSDNSLPTSPIEKEQTTATPATDPSKSLPTTFLGLDASQWQSMLQAAIIAQKVEAVGDKMTALLHAYEQGSDWDAFEATVNLVRSLDTLALEDRTYATTAGSYSAGVQGMSSVVNAIGDIIRLQQAMDSDDEWAVALNSVSIVDNCFDAYNTFQGRPEPILGKTAEPTPGMIGGAVAGAAASLISLGLSIKQLSEAYDDGDSIAKIQATLSVVQSGLSTYVALSQASAALGLSVASNAAGSVVPLIGCAIGVAQGLLSIADGDIQGGSEQIALAVATTVLCCIPVYGWIIALALQLGSATRGCDGQIIDTENIEEFTDDIAPGGEEAAHAAIVCLEKPAEWANDIYEDNIYYSGYNVEMWEKNGVHIPDDLEGQFGFGQANAEFFNPLRYAHYVEDLDEMSIGDIWDSLYISQGIAATIASIYKDDKPPEAKVRFTLNEDGQVTTRISGDAVMHEAAISMASVVGNVIEWYQAAGGRIEIDGKLPGLTVIRHEGATINYESPTGGKVNVVIEDMSRSVEEMRGVLYARDRGERIDSAIKVATDDLGEIDFDKVDAIMAGYGFGKTGMTYTYGETGKRRAASWDSGILAGGGNIGPQGQVFAAKAGDITSLAIRPEQLPSQKVADILRIASLNGLFTGPGSELYAMALGCTGGLFGLAASAQAGELAAATSNSQFIKPLDGFERQEYLRQADEVAQPEKSATPQSSSHPVPERIDPVAMPQFLDQHWPELLAGTGLLSEIPGSGAYFYRDSAVLGQGGSLADGSRASWWQHDDSDELFRTLVARSAGDPGFSEEPAAAFSGHLITPEDLPPDTVLPEPPPGIKQGAVFSMAEDTILRFLPVQLAEDTLAGGYLRQTENCRLVSFGSAQGGTIWQDGTGDLRFAPTPGFVGTGSFSYTVQTSSGELVEKLATVLVQEVNHAPELTDDSFHLAEGEIFYLDQLQANDLDPDGDSLHLDHLRGIEHGEVQQVGGRLAFVPEAGFHGDIEFSYWVRDHADAYPVMAKVSLTYSDGNTAPLAVADRFLTTEDSPLRVEVDRLLANDREYDGEALSFTGLGAALHGAVVLQADGSILFTPDADYCGTEAGFQYLVADASGNNASGWAAVKVIAQDDAPTICTTAHADILEDEMLIFSPEEVATFVRDVDGDALHLQQISNVTGGSIVTTGGYFAFVPDANSSGPASFDYLAADNQRGTVAGHLQFAILPVNDAIDTGSDVLNTTEEQAVTTTVATLLANDRDIDGSVFTFAGLSDARHGSVTVDGDGTVTFIPEIDYFGPEAGFAYRVEDSLGLASTGWVQVVVAGVNDDPAIIATTLEGHEDQPILFDGVTISRFISDPDGDAITLTELTAASGGRVSTSAGHYIFTPDGNYHGPAILSYRATDGHGAILTGALDLAILSQDDPTTFAGHNFTVEEDGVLVDTVAELMEGNSDGDGDGSLEFVGLGGASHGQVRMTDSGAVQFLPDRDYFGEDAGFAYSVRDGEGWQADGWVAVKVTGVADEAEVIGDRLYIDEDQALAFTSSEIARFIQDPDGDLFHLDMVSDVVGGRIEESGGIYTFIPDQDFYGEASLAYLASNSRGDEIGGQLHLGIVPVNDLPETTYFSSSGVEDQEVTMKVADLMAGAVDVEDGAVLRFGGIDSSLHGDVYVDPQGMIHFLPDKDFSGSAFFRYLVRDEEGGIGTGFVGVALAAVNDAPLATEDEGILAYSNNSYENIYLAETFLANDRDADNDPLRITAVGPAEFGSVALDGAGNVRYLAPSADWLGIDSFSYRIGDGNGGFAEAKAVIDVQTNAVPELSSELLFIVEDGIAVTNQADLLTNDWDSEGDSLRIIAVDQVEHGQVELLGDGTIRFTPELNYNKLYPGQASFRYTVSDGISDAVTAMAFFDIAPVNDNPIACGERIAGAVEDNTLIFSTADLLANDGDVEMASPYEDDALAVAGVFAAGHGQLAYDPASGIISYLPGVDFYGLDTFSYTVIDSHGGESVVQAEILVDPVNDRPVVHYDNGEAEDSVWNSYRISSLLGNDSDADGDILTMQSPHVISGHADIRVSGGSLLVRPDFREDRVVVGYTVSDGHGGETASQLRIDGIREHNFAPTFSGIYAIGWKNGYTVWFNFHAEDPNGGNTWGEQGDIVTINCSAPNVGTITDEAGFTFKFKGDVANASVILTAVDQAGASGSIYVKLSNLSIEDGNYVYSPVVFDLDGDGVELVDISAGVTFDWNRDGDAEGTGWAGRDDGFLVYDYDHDRIVSHASELVLREYDPAAATDLEGLRAFDSNTDGIFDAADETWRSFAVWQDRDGNGQTDDQEFATLEERGITAITLQSDQNFREFQGNIIHGETTFQWEDGSTGVVADVGLIGESLTMVAVPADGEDVDLLFDDAELNRLASQLCSDIAAYPADETVAAAVAVVEPVYDGDVVDIQETSGHGYQTMVC
ncbi:MAG: tandem-95 repeat protein [Desulforhopalus sp.]|nr:tandem-95 repeat protein [Desulforhopalus sp.]